ncbi:hypothetical protein I5Q34_00470 [Streptomyces sp. AV19]|uniref:hypothetical protein n=1 Tax=Streptomyces sp. AV19 TaxID=2793068 RepID=UPI0018FE3F4C|nr:hypothetical protein [Streptomyces sp. AV19]MBH1932782.1 hypothetical protein [Streptomyces sp. AV19]MDG4531453.1 hypothetical protein [Streptomyces sp. AV19]
MARLLILSMDVGQSRDSAAWVGIVPDGRRPTGPVPRWRAVVCETAPLGTPYEQLTAWTVRRTERAALKGWPVLIAVDATGVGRAVVESLRTAITARACADVVDVLAVTAHGGTKVGGQWPDLTVPKTDLVHTLLVDAEQQAVHIDPTLPAAHRLAGELAAYRAKNTPGGKMRYEHGRSTQHDDLVSAAQHACWAGRRWATTVARINRTCDIEETPW